MCFSSDEYTTNRKRGYSQLKQKNNYLSSDFLTPRKWVNQEALILQHYIVAEANIQLLLRENRMLRFQGETVIN